MPSRPMIIFIVGVAGIFVLHELNSVLGGLGFLAGIVVLLICLINKAIGPVVPVAEVAHSPKSEQVEVDLLHEGELYKVTLQVVIVEEIGVFHDTVVSREFWKGVFCFPQDRYPPTIQALNEAIGDYALAALGVLNDTISLRYPEGECRVGTVSVELVQTPTSVSVG